MKQSNFPQSKIDLLPAEIKRRGAALIIVLAFVVLLTGLIVAFFSRAMSERQVSNGSANETKTELFALGALDTITGDLKQEIAAGSTAVTTTNGANSFTVFIPGTYQATGSNANSVTAVPALSGTNGASPFAANLLKRSAYNQPFYSGAGYNLPNNTITTNGNSTTSYAAPNRAANIPTTTPSANGRYVSPARWNKALLLPKVSTASTTDFTPNPFTPPDWILVARDGSNPTAWNNNLISSGSNPKAVVGRYAYTIYDEGGLLDMNAAGYPSSANASQIGAKGSLAYADLTAVGLTQSQVDALVGWRNYASAQPGGTLLGGFTFDSQAATRYYNFAAFNTKGFLAVASNSLFGGQSDRMFSSRQELIKLLTQTTTTSGNLAAAQNSLQYLGTFSRDLEQPSFSPDPARPKNTDHDWVSTTSTSVGYGGNDAYDPAGARQDLINPALLTVLDSNGQPVMKRRFPLNRLAWITYNGPSANNLTDPVVKQSIISLGGNPSNANDPVYKFVAQGTVENIYKYFGLTWDASNSRWIYFHEDSASSYAGTTASSKILKLSEIAALPGTPREPDFFETLKAVIHCDSLGKQFGGNDGPTPTPPSPHLFYNNAAGIDGKVQYQIIQIGANLIDQFDSDSYPAHISFDTHEFYGIENLPYLAGWMQSWYRTYHLGAGDVDPNSYPKDVHGNPVPLTDASGNPVYPYESSMLCQPIVWNPHAPGNNPPHPGSLDVNSVPTSFRVFASDMTGVSASIRPLVRPPWWQKSTGVSAFPATASFAASRGMVASGNYSYVTYISGSAVGTSSGPLYAYTYGGNQKDVTINPSTSLINFAATPNVSGTDPGSFNEPYRLLSSNASVDSGYKEGQIILDPSVEPILSGSDGGTVIGFFCGKCWTGPSGYTSGTFYNPAGEPNTCLAGGYASINLKLSLQYLSPASGKWITYDVISDAFGTSNFEGHVSVVDNTDIAPQFRGFLTCFRADPRTDRWGLFGTRTFPAAVNPSGPNPPSGGYLYSPNPPYRWPQGTTISPYAGFNQGCIYKLFSNSAGGQTITGWQTSAACAVSDLMLNTNIPPSASYLPGNGIWCTDPDHMLRRAGGAYMNSTASNNNNDGLPLYTGNYNSRPVILNRPFQSITEMGYAFSDVPWKDLDFFTPESGDAAMLDAFCINEVDGAPANVIVGGRVNLNTKQPKVLEALIRGVSKAEGGVMSNSDSASAAQALVNWTTDTISGTLGIPTKGPLRYRSELVGKYITSVSFSGPTSSKETTIYYDGSKSYSGFSSMLNSGTNGVFATASDAAIKRRRECIMRALVDSGNTRTWNLMVDIVAQTGRYATNATSLDKFIVEGETRYWMHLAIDRYTGQVVAKLLEPVSE